MAATAWRVGEVEPSVFRIVEDDGQRIICLYLVRGPQGSLLVDTGVRDTPQRTLLPAFQHLGVDWDELTHVLITHADVDHCGGLAAIQRWAPNAETICGTEDRRLVEDVEAMINDRYLELVPQHGIHDGPDFVGWVRENADTGRCATTMTTGSLSLDPAAPLEIVPAPGHSPGHLTVHDRHHRLLIIGDAVLGQGCVCSDGSPDFPPVYRDADAYLATIQRLRALHATTLLTAHFPVMRGREVEAFWNASEAFWQDLDQSVMAALAAAPASLAELVARVAPSLRRWPPAADVTLSWPALAHLERAEMRGLVSREQGPPTRWSAIPRARASSTPQ